MGFDWLFFVVFFFVPEHPKTGPKYQNSIVNLKSTRTLALHVGIVCNLLLHDGFWSWSSEKKQTFLQFAGIRSVHIVNLVGFGFVLIDFTKNMISIYHSHLPYSSFESFSVMSRILDTESQGGQVSRLWSCSTLRDGLGHVDPAAGSQDEEALMKEIEETHGRMYIVICCAPKVP